MRTLGLFASIFASGCAVAAHEQRWTSVRMGDVEVLSSHDDETTRERVEDLARFQSVVSELSPLMSGAPEHATTVYLFGDARAFEPYKQHQKARGAMIARPVANFVVLDDSDPAEANRRLYHEYTHLLQYADRGQTYPRWYLEGFAEFMSTVEFARGEVRLGRIHPDRAVLLRHVDWLPFEQVVEWDGGMDADERTVGLLYAQSWALVHFLEMGTLSGFADRRAQTEAYLRAYGAGTLPATAFVQSFGAEPNALENDLLKHVHRAAAPYVARPESEFEIEIEYSDPVELTRGEVHTRLAELALELSDRGDDVAYVLAESAVELEPRSARAHVVRARSLVNRAPQRALEHFERASQLAPNDAVVALFHAQFLLDSMPDDADREQLSAVSDLLGRAGETRATASMSQGLRMRLLSRARDHANAIAALERAWASNRANTDIGIRLAREHIARGDAVQGCEIVRRLRLRPHLETRQGVILSKIHDTCTQSTPQPPGVPAPEDEEPTTVEPGPAPDPEPSSAPPEPEAAPDEQQAPELQRPKGAGSIPERLSRR